MAGTSSSSLRSAHVAATATGDAPATPAFTTSHAALRLTAPATPIESSSLISGGARLGQGIAAIPVSGEMSETPLIYGAFDDLIETLLQGTWASDVLEDAKASNSLYVENAIPAGEGGTLTMTGFRGVEAVGGTLNLASGAAANLSLNFLGTGSTDTYTTILTDATYTDPTNIEPLSSGVDVGTITAAGYTLDCMESATIEFAFEERDPQPKIGSDDMCGILRGKFKPVINANFYLEANFAAIYNAARDSGASTFAVTFPIGSVSGEKYTLTFPACRFGGTEIDFSSATVMHTVPILPQYSEADGCVCILTRAVL